MVASMVVSIAVQGYLPRYSTVHTVYSVEKLGVYSIGAFHIHFHVSVGDSPEFPEYQYE